MPRKVCILGAVMLLVTGFGVLSCLTAHAETLLVAATGSNAILGYEATTGAPLGTFASGDLLDTPIGIALGPDGNVYVANQAPSPDASSILRFNGRTGAFIDTFVPHGIGLLSPKDLSFGPDGNLYVANVTNGSGAIWRYNDTTDAFDVFASYDGMQPDGLVFGADGNLYVSDFFGQRVLRFNGTTGEFIGVFAEGTGMFYPKGLTFGPDGNLYVAMHGFSQDRGHEVVKYNGTTGAFIEPFTSGGDLAAPVEPLFAPDGNLLVSSEDNGKILRYNGTTGHFIDTFASGLVQPTFMTLTPWTIPEPSSLVLLFMFVASGVALWLPRRRRWIARGGMLSGRAASGECLSAGAGGRRLGRRVWRFLPLAAPWREGGEIRDALPRPR